jgi:hypothetical protein
LGRLWVYIKWGFVNAAVKRLLGKEGKIGGPFKSLSEKFLHTIEASEILKFDHAKPLED